MTVRLLHVITTLDRGGAEILLRNTVGHTDADETEGAVVCLVPPGPVAAAIEAHGWPVHSLDMAPGRARPRDLWRLRNLIRAIDPDVVHTWMYHADLLGGAAARMAGTPAVVWSLHHSAMPRGDVRWATRAIARVNAVLSWFIPHRIVATSSATLEFHRRLGYRRSRLVLVPTGFSAADAEPVDRPRVLSDLGIPTDCRVAIRVARLDPQKDYATFFAAAAALIDIHEDLHVVAVGRGLTDDNADVPLPPTLRGHSRLHLLGERADAAALIAASDVAVSSSAFGESTPLVIGEAMAAGVPVVATATGGCADLVGDAGRLVPPGHPQALADAIHQILCLPRRARERLSLAAQRRIQDRFSLTAMVRAYVALYREVLQGNSRAEHHRQRR